MSTKDEVDEDGYDDEEEEMDTGTTPDFASKSVITGRSITLQMLIADNIVEPGGAVLSLKYLGRKFIADLLPNGKIQTPATKEVFATPSAWAQHCKRQINPDKKSGCGWASVMYRGRKLDSWKTSWFRNHHPHSPAHSRDTPSPRSICSDSINGGQGEVTTHTESRILAHPDSESSLPIRPDIESRIHTRPDSESRLPILSQPLEGRRRGSATGQALLPLDLTARPAHTPIYNGSHDNHPHRVMTENGHSHQEEALNLSLKSTTSSRLKAAPSIITAPPTVTPPIIASPIVPPPIARSPIITPSVPSETNNNVNDRVSIRHASLKKRSQSIDPNTLVECETFSNLDKIQPFSVSMTTNATLLMDFHSHLTSSEVVGYLGGRWDAQAQHLSITEAYPCRCRLGDSHKSAATEDEIQKQMVRVGLSLVGWYHSHPYCQPDPSVKDIDCQMSYQLRMKGKGSTYFPCVGCIVAPYNRRTTKKTSSLQIFMVMPPLESQPSDYGIPMKVKYSLRQNPSVTEDLLTEMRVIADFYRGAPDFLKFRQTWQPSISYMDKIKCSLARRLPEDQMESGTFLDFVQHLLLSK